MTSEIMTKNGKYSSDWKWEKFKQPIFFDYVFILLLLGDQKNFDHQINGEDQPCHWLDDRNLVNENLKKKHLIIWWLKVQLNDHKFIYLLVVGQLKFNK
jgi:hypothetical protein